MQEPLVVQGTATGQMANAIRVPTVDAVWRGFGASAEAVDGVILEFLSISS